MSALRLGIIGGGHLGRIHAKLAASNEQYQVVGVADPHAASRATVAEQLGLPTCSDYHELLGKIDAAVVAAPTVCHYEIASTLLRSGVHCLVEKPLATTPDQAERLVQIAKHHRRILQVGHVERFNPNWTVAQTEMGPPKLIQSVRAGMYSGRSTDIGVVMDLMIHDLDLILSLDHSPLSSVQACGIAVLGAHEDMAEARLEFESGCVATLRASRLAQNAQDVSRRMQVYSTAGYADIDFSAEQVRVVKPTTEVLSRMVALDELPQDQVAQAKASIFNELLVPRSISAPKRNAILDEQNDFAISIQTNQAPAVSGEDGARAVAIASRIVDAIQAHAWDGAGSKPWRVGPQATVEPRILPLSPRPTDPKPTQVGKQRKAG